MRQYISFFRMRFVNGLQYRVAALAGVVTQFAWGALSILAFMAFYEGNPSGFPMEFQSLSSYIWLQQAFLALYMTWFFENELFDLISSGNIAYELCKPQDIYNMWFVRNIANRMAKAALRCIPVLIVAFLLPAPYGLVLPRNFAVAICFILSMGLSLLVVVSFSMLIYIATFYTINSMGIRIISASLVEFLSGAIIPLPFLPTNIRNVVELLPFASMQNVPFLIYTGEITGTRMIRVVSLQLIWITLLIFIGKVTMNKALKRIVVQGG